MSVNPETERRKAHRDAQRHGMGFLVEGVRVDPDTVEVLQEGGTQKLIAFFYLLLRDHLAAGVVDGIVQPLLQHEARAKEAGEPPKFVLSSKPLEALAREAAARLLR